MKSSVRHWAFAVLLVIPSLFVACGGGGDSTPPPPPPPVNNTPPVSSFTVSPTGAAMTPLIFDASASSDADGDALSYSWDFGDDLRGGAKKVAHTYAKGGAFTVKLTVGDGQGGTNSFQQTVTISAPPAPAKTVNVMGVIKTASGQPLEGVTLEVVGSAISATTDALGKASLSGVGAGNDMSYTVKLSKAGYAEQFKVLELPTVAESGYFEAELMARESALTLPDAAAGGALTGKAGAKVVLPPNALVDANGNAITGAVQVALSPVDVTKDIASFPGRFEGAAANGNQGLILSYGTVEYALSQNGKKLNLAPGKQASIEIPVYATLNKNGSSVKVGDNYPLWSLNEQTGGWTQEGRGIVVASGASPSGMALRGEVTHFSWWNHDDFDRPAPPVPPATDEDLAAGNPYKPKPKCMIDTNADGIPEDMSGTGYCSYETSTDPNYRPNTNSTRVRPQALEPTLPAWGASATLPTNGGQILVMPAEMDIVVNVGALNGTLVGTKTFRGAGNVEEEVVVILKSLATGGSCATPTAIQEPHLETYSIASNGQTQCFTLSAPAGFYEIQVARAANSSLTGSLKTIQPDNAVSTMDFSTTVAKSVVTHLANGISRIEVTAAANAPGAYRLEVKKVTGSGVSIALNTDINAVLTAGQVHSYSFLGTAGQEISIGNARLSGQNAANLGWNFPGNEFFFNDAIRLVQTGLHTVTMTNPTNTSLTYRLRVNTVQPAISLATPTSLTEITTTLQLGEVRRYSFASPLVMGELLALKLETASSTAVNARLIGRLLTNDSIVQVNDQSPKGLSEVVYVPEADQHILQITDGYQPVVSSLGGQFTVGVFRPIAQAMTPDATVTGTINPNEMLTHSVNIPGNGSYLLRGTLGAPAAAWVVSVNLWNADVFRLVNGTYQGDGGEFRFPVTTTTEETHGGLKAGRHTVAVRSQRINSNTAARAYTLSLVTLEEPTTIAIGAAGVNGVIDVPGERDYYRFDAAAGQAFTITATSPAFSGTIKVHKLSTTLDFSRPSVGYIFGAIPEKPLGTHTFTIPSTADAGAGTYIIQIDATSAQTGAYSLALTSP